MQLLKQNILNINTGIITHQVNCMGVMGAGIALEIRKKFPKAYYYYKRNPPQLGTAQVIKINEFENLYVCNMAGQKFYGIKGKYTDYNAVKKAMTQLTEFALKENLEIYVPYKMGCNLGGGDWREVGRILNLINPNIIVCKID